MDTTNPLADLLRYPCSRCQYTWVAVMTEKYGACDDNCGECGARHMSPAVVEMTPLVQTAPTLLLAWQTLKAAWDAVEDSNEVDWEDLALAVGIAEEALALLKPA